MKRDTPDKFRQSNAYAMQNGIILGLWSIAALALYILSFLHHSIFQFVADLMLWGSILLAGWLTLRFRQRTTLPGEAFPFRRAYVHTLLSGLYASVWIALAVYIYFWQTGGVELFNSLEQMSQEAEIAHSIAQMESSGALDNLYTTTGAENFSELIDALRSVSPASYAGMIVSGTLLSAPFIALIIALSTMRRAQPSQHP